MLAKKIECNILIIKGAQIRYGSRKDAKRFKSTAEESSNS